MNHLPWHYHRRTVISTHSLIPRDVDVDDTKDGRVNHHSLLSYLPDPRPYTYVTTVGLAWIGTSAVSCVLKHLTTLTS